jgi:hypothetical protein
MKPSGDGFRLTLLPDGDVCLDGEFRASRQRTQNTSGENDATTRSMNGCLVK